MAEMAKWHLTRAFSRGKAAKTMFTGRDYTDDFVEISRGNIAVAKDLVKESKRLSRAGEDKEAARLLNIANKLLDNNKRFQDMVGEVLTKSR